jgi:hypothetical protein
MKSIEIFKQIISNHIPEYKSSLDEAVLRDVKSLFFNDDYQNSSYQTLGNSNGVVSYGLDVDSDSEINELTLKQQLQFKEIDLNQIIVEFLADLSLTYIEDPESSDPIISLLLTSNNSEFLEQLEFAKELKQAFHRIERQEKKAQLKKVEEQDEDEVILAAFQRIERVEKKNQLQDLEEAEDLKPTGSGFVAYSPNEGLNEEYQLNKSVASKNQIPWKFIIRVAAVLILVLIPVGISILFFGDDETTVGVSKGPKPKGGKNIIYAETGDLSELKEIELPHLNNLNFSTQIDKKNKTQGYVNTESKIAISIIFNGDQIAYLDKKITLLDSKIKELKTKNIKDKVATLKSLSEISSKCRLDKQALELKNFTYEFDSKNFKLTIYTKNKIDPKKLKVYSIRNNDESMSYILKLFDKYFSLSKRKGSLVVITNQELLDELEEID